MISRRTVVAGLAFGAALIALPAWARPKKSVLAMIYTDNDGTVDLAEAKKAAAAARPGRRRRRCPAASPGTGTVRSIGANGAAGSAPRNLPQPIRTRTAR